MLRGTNQKIKVAAEIENLLQNLEEPSKFLSRLVLDVTTGFLALLCCKSTFESSSVLATFHENVTSIQAELTRWVLLGERRKTTLVDVLEIGIKEKKFVVRTDNSE